MKKIGEPRKITADNAWGRSATAIHTTYEVEESDVGTQRDHMGGYRYKMYEFRRTDVGCEITVMTDGTGWTCWTFN